jgi:hypothetical protein
MFETNASKFKKHFGPFDLDQNTQEITKCFFAHGPHFPGVIGMMACNGKTSKNADAFERQRGFYGGGMLLFPNHIQLGLRDLSFVDSYRMEHAWNRSFGGQFSYRGNVYNAASLTLDINNRSSDRLLEIAKDIAQTRWDTDVVLKVFPAGRIFLIKRSAR